MNWMSYAGAKDAILFALAIYAAFLSTLTRPDRAATSCDVAAPD
jgi:hypothetical protein